MPRGAYASSLGSNSSENDQQVTQGVADSASADAHESPMSQCEAPSIDFPWSGRIGVSPLLESYSECERRGIPRSRSWASTAVQTASSR